MRVFEHCEACSTPCGGGTVTRSMRRVANATLLRFDRYDEPPDSGTRAHAARAGLAAPCTEREKRAIPCCFAVHITIIL